MMKENIFILCVALGVCSTNIFASDLPSQKVVWTTVFRDIASNNPKFSDQYCRDHTPVVMVSTIKQITSKGITSSNGIRVRYLNHETKEKNGIYFSEIRAELSGKEATGKAWRVSMQLYEQMLSPHGQAYAIWSTSRCKGTVIGTPTVVHY